MVAQAVTRVDPHVKILDDEVVRRAKRAGLDVLVYAPHFTHISEVRDRARRYTDEGLLVVPAREYFTDRWDRRRHVLAIDPAEPIPDFLTFDATMAELDTLDATVLGPHPRFLTMSLSREDVLEYSHLFDAVEVYCPKNWWFHTRRMQSLASETDLQPYVSSYAHLPSTVGEVWTEYETTIETADDLRRAIEDDIPHTLYRNDGLRHELQCKAEFFHLARENTWEKFRRVVLENREATNPLDSRYDDRFAERSAY
jgi:predicted metal-dependent phosphoesterase TrpH